MRKRKEGEVKGIAPLTIASSKIFMCTRELIRGLMIGKSEAEL